MLEELIKKVREQINARISMRNEYATELDELRGKDDVDEARVEELRGKKASTDAELVALKERQTSLEKELSDDQAVARLQDERHPTGARADQRERGLEEIKEARTYAPESDPKGEKFLRDVAADYLGNRTARERLSRHTEEEYTERGDLITRGVTTDAAPGLVVPQYLVDLYASKGRPGRKFADQCRHHDLPETGMTVYIPRQVAITSTNVQAAELTVVSETDYADELIPVQVRTNAGSQTVSRQASERSLGTFDITFEDLIKSYHSGLDDKLLNSTWGLLAVANAVTYTDADPTAAELYRKILGGSSAVEDTLQDLDEDDLFTLMRGSRWAWLQGELTTQWPFIQSAGTPARVGGVSDDVPYSAGVRGHLPNGGDVVTDNNLPKNLGVGVNEDVIVVAARQELHLWEDPSAPLYIRAEAGPSVKSLGIDLVVYGYFAAEFARVVDAQGAPKAVHQKITGTGLVAPVF